MLIGSLPWTCGQPLMTMFMFSLLLRHSFLIIDLNSSCKVLRPCAPWLSLVSFNNSAINDCLHASSWNTLWDVPLYSWQGFAIISWDSLNGYLGSKCCVGGGTEQGRELSWPLVEWGPLRTIKQHNKIVSIVFFFYYVQSRKPAWGAGSGVVAVLQQELCGYVSLLFTAPPWWGAPASPSPRPAGPAPAPWRCRAPPGGARAQRHTWACPRTETGSRSSRRDTWRGPHTGRGRDALDPSFGLQGPIHN